MAAFTGVTSQGYVLTLTVNEQSWDVNSNTSVVTWSLTLTKPSNRAGWSNYTHSWAANIDGQGYGGNLTYNFQNYSTLTLGSGTKTVYHDPDGTKTIGVSGSFTESVNNIGSASTSGNVGLTTIPRASTMSFPNPLTAGVNTAFTINRASGSFTHLVDFYFGSTSGRIIDAAATSFTWTPSITLLQQIPNAESGTGFIRLHTYNGGTLVGYVDYTFYLNAPASAVPSLSSITISEATSGVASNVGAYVQNISKLNLAITGAAGYQGSTISGYKLSVAGQTLNTQSGVTTAITSSGTVPVIATVTDSRGRTASKTVNVTVLPYVPPLINLMTFQRATATGIVDAQNGTYIKVNINAVVQSLMNGTQRNQLVYRIYTRLRGTTPWVLKKTSALPAGTVSYVSYDLIGTFPVTEAHEVQVQISDDFNTTISNGVIATAAVFMHWGSLDQGLGIGKYWEIGRGSVDVKGQIYQNDGKQVVDTDYLSALNRGTALQRDTVYGTPSGTTAQQVQQDLGVQWYRTDKGWTEMYFTSRTFISPTVNGGSRTIPAGWYPVWGRVPIVSYKLRTDLTAVAAWDLVSDVTEIERLEFSTIAIGAITVPVGGRYEIFASQGMPLNTNSSDNTVRISATLNSTTPSSGVDLASTEFRTSTQRGAQGGFSKPVPLLIGDIIRFYLLTGWAGTWRSDGPSSYGLRYLGPI